MAFGSPPYLPLLGCKQPVVTKQLAVADLRKPGSDTFDEVEPIAVLFTRKTCAVCHQVLSILERLADEAVSGADARLARWTFAQVDVERASA